MADSEPGWLHYRLAVAFCSAVLLGITLLIVPLFLGILGGGGEVLLLYALVFSKWGAGAVLAAFVVGFALGSDRMAEFFSFMWGTHPFWTTLEYWFYEHQNLGFFLLLVFMLSVVGLFYQLG